MTRRTIGIAAPLVMLALFAWALLRAPADAGAAAAAGCQVDGRDHPDDPDDLDHPDDLADSSREAASRIAELERCLVDQSDVERLGRLGASYETAGRLERAEAVYRRALALDPHDGDLHMALGQVLLRRGAARAGRAEAEEALRWQPGRLAARDLIARASLSGGGMGR